jgi:hypothetical protein
VQEPERSVVEEVDAVEEVEEVLLGDVEVELVVDGGPCLAGCTTSTA